MNQHFRNRSLPEGNPLANALVIIVGIIVISLSLALGFVVFIGIAGFMLIMAAVVSARLWWFKRKFGAKAGERPRHAPGTADTVRVIEGEYREIQKTHDGKADDQVDSAENSQNR